MLGKLENMENTVYINRMQELITDLKGKIRHSNDAILEIEPGINVFDIHPFFESLKSPILESESSYQTFPCINMHLGDHDYYCDVIFKKERDFIAVLMFNYSDHYSELQKKIQKINGDRLES